MAEKETKTGLPNALSEQLGLLAIVVLFAGLVSTETYYAAFGIRYQYVELSIEHLISRGLTAVLSGPTLLFSYFIAIAWLSFGAHWTQNRFNSRTYTTRVATYVIVAILLVATYYSAQEGGRNSAQSDLLEQTSELPVIQSISNSSGNELNFGGYRLLLAGSDSVVIFKAVSSEAESPFIHILKRDSIGTVTITR